MHWINIDSDIGGSVEFQLHLDDYFPNIDLNSDDDSFRKRSGEKFVKESNDYQTVLCENNICKSRSKDKSADSNVEKVYSHDKQTSLLKYNIFIDKNLESKIMDDNNYIIEQIRDLRNVGVNMLSYKPLKESDILISPDKTISLVSRKCPYCGHVGGHYHDFYGKQMRNKRGMKEKYRVILYRCLNCSRTYSAFTYKKLNELLKDEINLDERIREFYAKSGLSYDKIAEIVGTFYDISISHQYVKNVIEEPVEGFKESIELVILPDDFKINGKTSKERKVTDIATVYMFKRTDVDYSGDVTADEVFLRVMGDRQYLVSIMDHNISDMPIALAVIPTRKFEVMKAVFDFVFENNQLKSLTSDMFSVYGQIADDNDIPQQECTFHSMNYVGDKIYKELKKKDKYDSHDKIWIYTILTEYREILRQLNYGDAVDKAKDFLKKLEDLPDFFEKIGKHLKKHFLKLVAHLQHDGVVRTSNKCETFNSLPQIRRIKNISKVPLGLLHRLACTVKYYVPNRRTLQNRGDWHILPQ
jgi:DNA-directed RNA polymerase subunit RPC12/RpoP